ncbi:hypothetical protein J6590_081582 [Homalodisca vitripennis]|nr:hypothetical protein J6590_081582 [Homalodisca vitripennis]
MHVDDVYSRASRTLGLIMHTPRHGFSTGAATLLLKSVVRQVLEYDFPWKNVLRDYDLQQRLTLQPLVARRRAADLMLMHKLFRDATDCPPLLEVITFRSRNYLHWSHIPRLLRFGNELCTKVMVHLLCASMGDKTHEDEKIQNELPPILHLIHLHLSTRDFSLVVSPCCRILSKTSSVITGIKNRSRTVNRLPSLFVCGSLIRAVRQIKLNLRV